MMNSASSNDAGAGPGRQIRAALIQFLVLAALALVPPLIIYLDVQTIKDSVGEISLTEVSQTLCLLLTVTLFASTTWQQTESRGFYVLVTGFFLCMLIREHDFVFDLIRHGAWVYPALAVTLTALVTALIWRHTVVGPMAAFTRLQGYHQLILGLVVVLVFSRVFGTGSLWRAVMLDEYQNLYKSVIQEGLELFGYLLIAYGTVQMTDWRHLLRRNKTDAAN
ncbi:hypothetical protein [Marinobacterium iners]|nr:hypothetical protein [Marinobacterium iners]